MAQGAVGYVQYFTGVPWLLVAVHVAGACAVWVAVLRVPVLPSDSLGAGGAVELGQNGSNGSIATARNTTVR